MFKTITIILGLFVVIGLIGIGLLILFLPPEDPYGN